jgi:hypothetical protein
MVVIKVHILVGFDVEHLTDSRQAAVNYEAIWLTITVLGG